MAGPKKPKGTTFRWPIFESLKQAAAMTHWTKAELSACKATKSKAFIQGGRVDCEVLVRDMNDMLRTATDLPAGFASWDEFGKSRRAKISDIELQEKQKLLMPTAEAVRHAATAGGMFMSELERLGRELPPALAGMPVSGVAARIESEFETLRRRLKIKMQEIE